MPESQAPVAPISAPSAPAAPSTPSSEGAGTSSGRSYTEAEYNAVQSELSEHKRQLQNAATWIDSDPEVKGRLDIYGRAIKENKPYTDLVKEWEATKTSKSAPKDIEKAGFTAEQAAEIARKIAREEFSTASKPFLEGQAKQILNESRENILKENTWATEKDWETFNERFNEKCQGKAEQIYKSQNPRLNQQQAWEMAVGSFTEVDDSILWDSLMKPEREQSILGQRRVAPRLPDGMVDRISTGKDADVLDKARKAYKSVEGDGDKVAKIVAEYAPQLGVDPQDRAGIQKIWSLISKE